MKVELNFEQITLKELENIIKLTKKNNIIIKLLNQQVENVINKEDKYENQNKQHKQEKNIHNRGTEILILDERFANGLEGKVMDYCEGLNKYIIEIKDLGVVYIDKNKIKVKNIEEEITIKDVIISLNQTVKNMYD